MTYRYRVHGLGLASDIELCELAADPSPMPPDIVIRRAPVPHDLYPSRRSSDGYLVQGRDILFAMPRVGRFLARSGKELLADPEPGADQGLFSLYLLGSALAAVLHQRRFFPIHASAVAFKGNCFAFMGDSGAGKSTLAAMLAARGFELVSEDVLVVKFDETRGPMVEAGIPILKLWPDALAPARLGDATTTRESNSDSKQRIAALTSYRTGALPLRRLYQLRWMHPRTAVPEISRIPLFDGVFALRRNIYRNGLIEAMDREQAFLAFAAELVRSVELFDFHRPMSLATAEAQVDDLVNHLESGQAP